MKLRRFGAVLALLGMLISVGAGPASAQDSTAGNITSCSDLRADYVDAGSLVTVTANDGTSLDYTSTVAVTAVVTGGDRSNVYPSATSGTGLSAPLDGDGNVPAISGYLFCSVPSDEEPAGEEPTCETDPALCEEPTCETDPTLCEEPTDEEPGTCPGGADGFPECNPQVDAEVNLSVDCANANQDGTYLIGGVFSVTNQSEHAQDIRITEVVGPTVDSEAFFLGQVILNGQTLSYPYQSVWIAGDDPDARVFISVSVLFESVQGRGTVREPRGDVEDFFLDAKDPCVDQVPVDEEPTPEPTVEPMDGEPTPEPTEAPVTSGLDEQVVALPKTGSGPLRDVDSPMFWIVLTTASLLAGTALGMRGKRT